MIKKYNNFLNEEKSSLIELYIPKPVMQDIQKDYMLPNDVKWIKFNDFENLEEYLKSDKLILSYNKTKVYTFFVQYNRYYGDCFSLDELEDWGGEWVNVGRKRYHSFYEIERLLSRDNTWYMLGDYDKETKTERDTFGIVDEKELVREKFLQLLLKKIKRLLEIDYKSTEESINKIISNLHKFDTEKVKDLSSILKDNKELMKITSKSALRMDKLKKSNVRDTTKKGNSLSILDMFLMRFEVELSVKYDVHLSIADLCNKHGEDKMVIAFLHYLITNRITMI